jgi:hypothetical protein
MVWSMWKNGITLLPEPMTLILGRFLTRIWMFGITSSRRAMKKYFPVVYVLISMLLGWGATCVPENSVRQVFFVMFAILWAVVGFTWMTVVYFEN